MSYGGTKMNENNEFDYLKQASYKDVLKLIVDKQRAQFKRSRFSTASRDEEDGLSLSESVRADMKSHFEILALTLLLVEKILLEPAGKTVRRCLAILTCAIVLVCVSGCGAVDNAADDGMQTEKVETINFDDIKWSIGECVFEGERCVGLDYTNNTQYPLLGVEIKFALKETLTEEQRAAIESFKEDNKWAFDDEEDEEDEAEPEDEEDEEVEEDENIGDELEMRVSIRRYVEPGKSINGVPCLINGFLDFDDMLLYEAMEPDVASIAFVGTDNKLHLVFYDFYSKTITESNYAPVSVDGWSDSGISKLVPRVEAKAIIIDYDDDDWFSFEAYGVSYDYFKRYVDACKEAGFANIDYDEKNTFSAENADGYEVDIEYSNLWQVMSVSIDK